MKAAEEKYGNMEDPMPSTVSAQLLISFPVLCPFPTYFLHFC